MGAYGYEDFLYSYPFDADAFAQGALSMLLGILGAVLVLVLAVGLIFWVFESMGLYAIAMRRKIYHAWLAWLPIGNMWILGSISDQYQLLAQGKSRGFRHALLWMDLSGLLLSVLWWVAEIALNANGGLTATSTMVGLGILVPSLISLLSLALSVVTYIALFDLFRAACPGNAVVYLLLSIFLPFCLPFFIFALRNKDDGILTQGAAPV